MNNNNTNILLDNELGVNPTLTYCPRCHKEGNELLLVGKSYKYECNHCHIMHIGKPKNGICPACSSKAGFTNKGKFDGSKERLPASQLCADCQKEENEHRKIVESGGIYFRCESCGCSGVIKPNSFAEQFRKAHNIKAPGLCGVSFDKTNCPQCSECSV